MNITDAPKVEATLKDTRIEEGKNATLSAKCSALPEPTVKWFKDGNEVSADARIKISKDASGSYSLALEKCTTQDQGSYEVRFTNALGEVSASCTLSVDCKFILSWVCFGSLTLPCMFSISQ